MPVQDDRIGGALQENLLTLLCFDAQRAGLVRAAVTPQLFESAIFREVAGHAIDHLDAFGAPIAEHLPDELEHILTGDDKRKATIYRQLLDNLFLAREGIQGDYVVSQLHKFVRQQNLKSAVINAVGFLESGDIDRAEVEIQKGLNSQAVSFEQGTQFADPVQALAFLDHMDPPLLTGIDVLDRHELGPCKKEYYMILAPSGKGKTWGLIHLGKWALLQQQTVVHITLEMSEARTAQRYLQSFFSVSKHAAKVRIPTFSRDKDGGMNDVFYEEIERLALSNPDVRAKLSTKIKREFRRRPPLIIKQFPTGALTLPALEAYLDGLERHHKIQPDVLIIDYPDLMHLSADNQRVDMSNLHKQLRGIAVKRNLALIGASQSNREGSRARVVDETMLSEDFSKMMIADSLVSYSQTEAELKLGLARLFAVKSRNDESKFSALITQSYAVGQFCLDSVPMEQDYWQYLEQRSQRGKPRDD